MTDQEYDDHIRSIIVLTSVAWSGIMILSVIIFW